MDDIQRSQIITRIIDQHLGDLNISDDVLSALYEDLSETIEQILNEYSIASNEAAEIAIQDAYDRGYNDALEI